MDFKTNHQYQYTPPVGTVTFYGQALIVGFLSQQRIHLDDWLLLNPDSTLVYIPPMPDDWHWEWLVRRGEFRGTFPKRVAQFYHKRYGLKCPDSFLSKIGNLAKEHSLSGESFTFDFTQNFDWSPGEFGDSGSCYWDENRNALDMLRENDGYAVRFYYEGKGFARAWFTNIAPGYVLWNGYGLMTSQIAQILAGFWGVTYKRITLVNQGGAGGTVWINGGIGYLIGSEGAIEPFNRFDLSWENLLTCHDCGCSVDDEYHGADGEYYCDYHFYHHFERCGHCGEVYYQDVITYIESAEQDVCDFCRRLHYSLCSECDEYALKNDMTALEDGRTLCDDCHYEFIKDENDENQASSLDTET